MAVPEPWSKFEAKEGPVPKAPDTQSGGFGGSSWPRYQLWVWAQQSSNQGKHPGLPGGGTAGSSRATGNVPCVWFWLLPRPKHYSQNWSVSGGPHQRLGGQWD